MRNCIDCGKKLSKKKYKRCRSCNKKIISKIMKEKLINPINHPNWKGGLPKCIDCKKEISRGSKRCRLCSAQGKNNSHYNDGRSIKICLCIDCRKELVNYTAIRCNKCAQKLWGLNHRLNNHYNWQGGISFEEYGAEFDNVLKEQVRFRDHYKCQICGCSQLENGRQLDCHHIDYDKLNNVLRNLIALCKKCHTKTNYNREYWKKHFKEVMSCLMRSE